MKGLKKRPCPECGVDMEPVDDGTYFCSNCDDHVDFDGEDDDDPEEDEGR